MAALPLDARRHKEFFLTAAQSLFAVSLLLRLRLSLVSGMALLALFLTQLGCAFVFEYGMPTITYPARAGRIGLGYNNSYELTRQDSTRPQFAAAS